MRITFTKVKSQEAAEKLIMRNISQYEDSLTFQHFRPSELTEAQKPKSIRNIIARILCSSSANPKSVNDLLDKAKLYSDADIRFHELLFNNGSDRQKIQAISMPKRTYEVKKNNGTLEEQDKNLVLAIAQHAGFDKGKTNEFFAFLDALATADKALCEQVSAVAKEIKNNQEKQQNAANN